MCSSVALEFSSATGVVLHVRYVAENTLRDGREAFANVREGATIRSLREH